MGNHKQKNQDLEKMDSQNEGDQSKGGQAAYDSGTQEHDKQYDRDRNAQNSGHLNESEDQGSKLGEASGFENQSSQDIGQNQYEE